jgi:probable rRNA maturation factor
MVISRQSKVKTDVGGARVFARRLARELKLGRRHFNVCLVDDQTIRDLNAAFRSQPHATDVLSFAWAGQEPGSPSPQDLRRRSHRGGGGSVDGEFRRFLGDVVISVETARRNARSAGHATDMEIRWLILHGLLHLLGMDHETDNGEMESLELGLRGRLGLNESKRRKRVTAKPRLRTARKRGRPAVRAHRTKGPENAGRT